MRLIDADALEKRLDNEKWMDNYDRDFIVDVALDEAQTVDAAPVVHGRWLNFYGDFTTAECTECGEICEVSATGQEDYFEEFKQCYKFCPCCGAKMDGDRNE